MIPDPSLTDAFLYRTLVARPENAQEKLARFHLTALQHTLSHAKNSRFYGSLLAHVHPESITQIKEFEQLPFTFPHQIRKNPKSFLAVSQDDIHRIVTLYTSGTTAAPKRIFFTANDLELTVEFFTTVLSRLMAAGETGLILLPGHTPASAGDLIRTAMEIIHATGIVHGVITDFQPVLDLMAWSGPSIIIGLPVQVLALSELIKKKRLSPCSVRHVILTSDYSAPALRNRIESLLNCRVLDHYGMTETGFGGGIDCFHGQGYHVRETDLYIEIIDPDTGKPVPTGGWGEVVITTLSRQGMPLIRYRTGDVSRILAAPCPCGSPFRRMDHVRGRRENDLLLQSGTHIGLADLDDLFFRFPRVVDYIPSAVQTNRGWRLDICLNLLDLKYVPVCFHELIDRYLSYSPVLESAVDTGEIRFGDIRLREFRLMDSYTGKRQIAVFKQSNCPE